MFKTNLDLANVEHSPYLYNDLEGGFHWDFWNYEENRIVIGQGPTGGARSRP